MSSSSSSTRRRFDDASGRATRTNASGSFLCAISDAAAFLSNYDLHWNMHIFRAEKSTRATFACATARQMFERFCKRIRDDADSWAMPASRCAAVVSLRGSAVNGNDNGVRLTNFNGRTARSRRNIRIKVTGGRSVWLENAPLSATLTRMPLRPEIPRGVAVVTFHFPLSRRLSAALDHRRRAPRRGLSPAIMLHGQLKCAVGY